MTQELPAISIVVIGRNEGERLVRCLKSVREADYPADKLELIYVDTDSVDDSCAAAAELGAKVIAIHPDRPTAGAARNAGLHAASHELIQFLDGDTILDVSWLKKAVDVMRDADVTCVFGRLEEVSPGASIYNFWAHHDWYFPPGRVEACGGVAMFRRPVLLEAGGYDSSLIAGEERDLCFRLIRDQNATIICLDELMALHDIHMTRFRQYWRRAVRAGYTYAQISARHPGIKSWRRTCRRNVLHACAAAAAIVLSLALWRVLPVAVWLSLLALAMVRNALRCRHRVGSTGGALLYAVHHLLCKLPAVVGYVDFYFRRLRGAGPKRLMEYRADVTRGNCQT
jgi:glycosyltransferase involved in cell wall biosynthesis